MAETPNHAAAVALFRFGPAMFEAAIQGVAEEESLHVPASGKWNIRQIARHLTDTEIVAGMRLRQIIAEDMPLMAVFDQDLWAANLGYSVCDPHASAALFRSLRSDMSSILESLPAEAFARVGIHPERGEWTLLQWVKFFGAHVENHTQQIANIRKTWGRS